MKKRGGYPQSSDQESLPKDTRKRYAARIVGGVVLAGTAYGGAQAIHMHPSHEVTVTRIAEGAGEGIIVAGAGLLLVSGLAEAGADASTQIQRRRTRKDLSTALVGPMSDYYRSIKPPPIERFRAAEAARAAEVADQQITGQPIVPEIPSDLEIVNDQPSDQ